MTTPMKQKPHVVITAEELAKWLEGQPERWWLVDGDPVLSTRVDFPCPSDELASAFRSIGNSVWVFDSRPNATAAEVHISADQLGQFADTTNTAHKQTFLCSWKDSEVEWLLSEDEGSSSSAE